MLQIPKLNDQNLESILELAIRQMKTENSVWNDFDVHDPGMTFLELLAQLKQAQQEKTDRVGKKSLDRFLTILGLERKHAVCASALVEMETERDFFLPEGTKLKVFDLVFETAENAFLWNNAIRGIGMGREMQLFFQEYNASDRTGGISLFGEIQKPKRDFYIFFQNPLPVCNWISLYFELKQEEKKRNPIGKKEDFISLSSVVWEYYGEEKGRLGWHLMETVEDETVSFLFSGQIKLKLKGQHKVFPVQESAFFCIRVRVLEYGYEKPPVVEKIRFNTVSILQRDTKCNVISFTLQEFLKNRMEFTSYLASEGTSRLFIRCGSGFLEAEQMGISYLVKEKEPFCFQLGTSGREFLFSQFQNQSETDVVFQLVLYESEYQQNALSASGYGFAEQKISLFKQRETGKKEIPLFDSFQLWIYGLEQGEEKKKWNFWEKTNRFDGLFPQDKKYKFDPEKAEILFGNNEHGKVPSKGTDNIVVVSLAWTAGTDGNIQKGSILSFCRKGLLDQVKVVQFCDSTGGRKEETVEEALKRMSHALEAQRRYAVTIQDYEKFAKETPGILVEHITVIPLYQPFMERSGGKAAENSITIVAEPDTHRRTWENLDRYLQNIQKQMDKVRLITTKVFVMIPQYIPIEIDCEILVDVEYWNLNDIIFQKIENLIASVQKTTLGMTIYHGDVYKTLESMKEVRQIRYLKLEFAEFQGKSNAFGDLQIPPYARIYLKQLHLTLDDRFYD